MHEAMIACVAVTTALAASNYVMAYAARQCQACTLATRVCRHRAVVLTFDDGPGRELTPRLLDLLGRDGAHASFFLLGRRVPGHEEVVQRAAAEGHELACHGQNHLNAWKCWPWQAVRDMHRGYATLKPWVVPDAPFRPPFGKLVLPTWWAARRRGSHLAWWTVDSGDTHAVLRDPQLIAETVARAGGGVVLLHDFDREHDRAERATFVLRTTEALLGTAKKEGLAMCRYSDLWRPGPTAGPAA